MSGDQRTRIGLDAHLLSFAGSYRQAGVSRYIAELLRAFASDPTAAGDHDYLAFVGPEPVPAEFLPTGTNRVQFVHSRLPTSKPPVRIGWEQAASPVAAARARLALLHGPVNVLPLLGRTPGVVTIHDLAFLAYPDVLSANRRRYLTLATTLSARRAAQIIAVSAFTRDEIVRRLRINPTKITVVHNAVDPTFRPLPADEIATFRAEKELQEPTILCVGTLEPRKNLTRLLRAFAQIAGQTTAELVVVGGQGWLYDDALALVATLGLRERVRFPGFVPDEELPRWYNAATIFVYPSLYEGFGLPALEALACGVPTITSAGTAMAEIVGEAAVLTDPQEPAALAAAMLSLLNDRATQARLRQVGPVQAATFRWQQTARATRAVYDQVLASRQWH